MCNLLQLHPNFKFLCYFFFTVFNDGTKKDLFCLDGTIPVTYKGSVYNIPVCICLMDTHPKNAPICYVRPTADMLIKVSQYVDHNGKVYLPYLHDWSPSDSDLLVLTQVMISTFGDFMPVYAKRKSNTATTTPYPAHCKNHFQPVYSIL